MSRRWQEMNWPTAREGRFILMMRRYRTKESSHQFLDGSGDAGCLKQPIADNLMLAG
jgi:hypothetical protein